MIVNMIFNIQLTHLFPLMQKFLTKQIMQKFFNETKIVRQAVTNCQAYHKGMTSATDVTYRARHIAGIDCHNLQAIFANFFSKHIFTI